MANPVLGAWSDGLVERMAQHRAELLEDGYTIVEGLIDSEVIERVKAAVTRLGGGEYGPANAVSPGRRVGSIVTKDTVFQDLAMIEEPRYLLGEVLGSGYLLTTNTSIEIVPGEQAGPIHTDELLYTSLVPSPHPPLVCNTMWAIDDFTVENGATVVVPGSHTEPFPIDNFGDLSPDMAVPAPKEQAVMRAGSVLVFQGALWHTGGSNRSAANRLGIALNFCAGWIRPETANLLAMPLDEVRELAPPLQDMLGFGLYKGFIGHLDMQPPLAALASRAR